MSQDEIPTKVNVCWILLGVIMAWADIYGTPFLDESVREFCREVDGDKALDIPETVSDSESYLETRDIPCDIPPMFKRDKEAEATAKKADVYVRFMAK
jgi:hypothetical protein